jgi:hypothetical protein
MVFCTPINIGIGSGQNLAGAFQQNLSRAIRQLGYSL